MPWWNTCIMLKKDKLENISYFKISAHNEGSPSAHLNGSINFPWAEALWKVHAFPDMPKQSLSVLVNCTFVVRSDEAAVYGTG